MTKINPKVTSATVGAAVVTLITALLAELGVTVSAEIAAAAATLIAFAAGYLKSA
jgi:hypothetical protein